MTTHPPQSQTTGSTPQMLAASSLLGYLVRNEQDEELGQLVDLMFDRQAEWAFTENPKAALLAFVRQAGFTEESFNACLTNKELQDGVLAVKNRGSSEFGVSSTPTFFVNGELHKGEMGIEEIDEILAD